MSGTINMTWDKKCFLKKQKASCGYMQVSQKAGLKWQLAICAPRASFAEHQPKRKWYPLCGLLYFVAFVTTEFFTQSEARAFHSWREGWETLISSDSIFSAGGLKESSFTFLCSLAPCYRECQNSIWKILLISYYININNYINYYINNNIWDFT